MLKKKLSASLTALALFAFAAGAQAVALGDLNVESRSGEPFEAKLEIVDVDPTVSPLLVRIAPPSVYERQARTAPQDIYALKMERLSGGETVVLRLFSEAPLESQTFPLLIEMNAGGKLSLREYDLGEQKPVTPRYDDIDEVSDEPPAQPAAQAKKTEAESAVEHVALVEKSPEGERLEKAKQAPKGDLNARNEESRKQDRAYEPKSARRIVSDYIAVHGFDATRPMTIEKGMTLWSVSRAYWPSYRGATFEQLIVGFRNQNPAGFEKGNPNGLLTGVTLNPPKLEDVLAINPVEAFREVHGDDVAIPLSTQNLIDAQLVNAEIAGNVADAQDRERNAGGDAQSIADAGRTALEDKKAELAYERNLVTDSGKPLGETRQILTDKVQEKTEPRIEAGAPVTEAVEKTLDKTIEPAPAEKVAKVEKTEKVAVVEEKPQDKKKSNMPWTLIMGILVVIGFVWYFRRQRSCCQGKEKDRESDGQCTCGKPVTVQKEIPPSTDAQMTALKTTVDEAVKNGTTGGAMGVGTQAFLEAKMAEEKRREEDDFKADVKEVEPVIVPEEALSDEDRAVVEKTKKMLDSVSLDLDDGVPEAETQSVQPSRSQPVNAVKDVEESSKEQAYTEALDARIELAEGFIKYGALKEANEVFDEVMQRGTPEQKERVAAIRARLAKDGAQ